MPNTTQEINSAHNKTSQLLQVLVDTYKRYVILSDNGEIALAAWTLFTYAHDIFQVSPLLVISSPERRCGKTTLMSVIQHLVANPMPTSHITPAAVFRIIERDHPTLVIDEGDAFLKGNEDMRGILNSGHTRHMAFVHRTTGDNHEPKAFSTWSPKVIALIGNLSSTLMDRSVVIRMRRRLHGEDVKRLRLDRPGELFTPINEACAAWAEENMEALAQVDPEVPSWLNDRAADNWRPLLSIASLAGDEWLRRALEAIRTIEDHEDEEELAGTSLLSDIRLIFRNSGKDRLQTNSHADGLLNRLLGMEDRPWKTYNRGSELSERQLAQKLKPFDIRPRTIRLSRANHSGTDTAKGYMLRDFEDAFTRYLPAYVECDVIEELVTEEQLPAARAAYEMLPCDGLCDEVI